MIGMAEVHLIIYPLWYLQQSMMEELWILYFLEDLLSKDI